MNVSAATLAFDINLSILEPVAELRVFQAALTTHDIDADSAIWTRSSIITDDRSSCRFSDNEEVSVCMYIIMLQLSEKST